MSQHRGVAQVVFLCVYDTGKLEIIHCAHIINCNFNSLKTLDKFVFYSISRI